MTDIQRGSGEQPSTPQASACEMTASRLVEAALGIGGMDKLTAKARNGEIVGATGIAKMHEDHAILLDHCNSMAGVTREVSQMIVGAAQAMQQAGRKPDANYEARRATMLANDVEQLGRDYSAAEAHLPGSGKELMTAAEKQANEDNAFRVHVTPKMDNEFNQPTFGISIMGKPDMDVPLREIFEKD